MFRYNVDGQQLIAVGGANNTATLLNADKTIGQGVELDLEAYLADNVLLTFGQLQRHRDQGQEPCGGDLRRWLHHQRPDHGHQRRHLCAGERQPAPQAPKWIHNATLRVGFPLSDGSELYAYTDWAYRSAVNFFIYESPEFRGRSSLEGGLRLGYNWDYGQYDVAVFGRNLTNQTRVVGAIDFNNLTGFLNEPRTWGVEFTAKF